MGEPRIVRVRCGTIVDGSEHGAQLVVIGMSERRALATARALMSVFEANEETIMGPDAVQVSKQ